MARRVATPAQLYKLNRAGCLGIRETRGEEVTYPQAFEAIQALEGGDSAEWVALRGESVWGHDRSTPGDAETPSQG